MINLILTCLLVFTSGFVGALLGCWLFSKRKWQLYFNEEEKSIQLIQESPGKAEFLTDATAAELEDMAKPAWSKFLEQFKIRK